VLDILDPNNLFFTARIFRQSCYEKGGLHIKDLRIIANRDLRDIILVDNFMYSYSFQMENGVPILPYFGGKDDD
jgi:CTD small phosphatase-like protein 2